ncbi:MAG: ATP synthase subunit I [Desulfobacterales bacterium]|nr:ATP synthase subunit I [Desulfobacterales bacterium]
MGELLPLMLALTAGMGLGIFYFGGLWLTVRRLPTARRPAFLSLLSFFGRLGVVLFGFYLVMGSHWERLLVCLFGFLAIRIILVRLWGPQRTSLTLPS